MANTSFLAAVQPRSSPPSWGDAAYFNALFECIRRCHQETSAIAEFARLRKNKAAALR